MPQWLLSGVVPGNHTGTGVDDTSEERTTQKYEEQASQEAKKTPLHINANKDRLLTEAVTAK